MCVLMSMLLSQLLFCQAALTDRSGARLVNDAEAVKRFWTEKSISLLAAESHKFSGHECKLQSQQQQQP